MHVSVEKSAMYTIGTSRYIILAELRRSSAKTFGPRTAAHLATCVMRWNRGTTANISRAAVRLTVRVYCIQQLYSHRIDVLCSSCTYIYVLYNIIYILYYDDYNNRPPARRCLYVYNNVSIVGLYI